MSHSPRGANGLEGSVRRFRRDLVLRLGLLDTPAPGGSARMRDCCDFISIAASMRSYDTGWMSPAQVLRLVLSGSRLR